MMNISRKDSVKQGIGLIRVYPGRTRRKHREHSDVTLLDWRRAAAVVCVTHGTGSFTRHQQHSAVKPDQFWQLRGGDCRAVQTWQTATEVTRAVNV